MEQHMRDPRAQKHREAEKRHREKLADNLELLRNCIPGVSAKEQKAEIYAKASAYIIYLRSMVPQDKWIPPAHTFAAFLSSLPSGEEVRSDEVPPPAHIPSLRGGSLVTSPTYAQSQAAATYQPQFVQMPPPTMMQSQIPMQGMASGMAPMMSMRSGVMTAPHMYYGEVPTHAVYMRDLEPARYEPPLQPMPQIGANMYVQPDAGMPGEAAIYGDESGVARKRKHKPATAPAESRPGTSDSGMALIVDGRTGHLISDRFGARGDFEEHGEDEDVKKSSNRRRRRVEGEGGEMLDSSEYPESLLDTLATAAATSSNEGSYEKGPARLGEGPQRYPQVAWATETFSGAPLSPGSEASSKTGLESMSRLSLSRTQSDPRMTKRVIPPPRYTWNEFGTASSHGSLPSLNSGSAAGSISKEDALLHYSTYNAIGGSSSTGVRGPSGSEEASILRGRNLRHGSPGSLGEHFSVEKLGGPALLRKGSSTLLRMAPIGRSDQRVDAESEIDELRIKEGYA